MKNRKINCEDCMNYVYDDEYEEYLCVMNLDEDDMGKFIMYGAGGCPYYRFGDDYTIVKKQM